MKKSLSQTTLSNGKKVFCLNKHEVPFTYEEVPEYIKNGIELHEGDSVFDVGANIGLFSLWVYWQFHNNVNVYAFEPIPAIFEVLQANAQRFDQEKLKVFPYGLSVESKKVTFAYHPNCTTLSTAHIDTLQDQHDELRKVFIGNIKPKDVPPSMKWLLWLPPFLQSLIIHLSVKRNLQTQEVICQLKSLSEMILELNIKQIDLLKVDVQDSELEVILGIAEDDWYKIKQVVVEIHNVENRVKTIKDLLTHHGFSQIIVEQEPIFMNTNIFNLYAIRK